MKKYILSFLIFTIFVFLPLQEVFAVEGSIEKSFILFVKKIEVKYTLSEELALFERLADALELQETKKLSNAKKDIIQTLLKLNNEVLFEKRQELSNSQSKQIEKEEKERENLKKELSVWQNPSFIESLLNSQRTLYKVNSAFEFIQDNSIQKIVFSNYYPLSLQNSSTFKSKKGVIVKNIQEQDYWFVEDFTVEQKIPYSKLSDSFLAFVRDDTNFVLEKESYFGFVFSRFSYLEDTYGVYISGLKKLGIDAENSLLYQDDSEKYHFVTEYRKVFLADQKTLFWIPNKEKILLYLRDDAKEGLLNSSATLSEIQKKAQEMSRYKTREQKISSIYAWVIDHLEYSKVVDFEDAKIFSGLESYENKEGVCTGYTKLTAYMLAFAGVSDLEVVLGDVIDAQDFPQVWHAWIQIGDSYYDPTFDDPVWNTSTRTPEQYRYYALPEDLFYTNRYKRDTTPQSLKSTELLYRKTRVELSLSKLVEKYSWKWYNLLKPFDFRNTHGLTYSKDITPEVLKNIIPFYEVDGKTFSFIDNNGSKKYIKGLNYYTIDNATTETALSELDFDITGLYLFAWKSENGNTEYRLSYDVVF
jgi:FtsZ-binding cell division protein ZapB